MWCNTSLNFSITFYSRPVIISSVLFTGSSAAQEQATDDTSQSAGQTVDEEAELRELEFRARALESLVRARERQMKT